MATPRCLLPLPPPLLSSSPPPTIPSCHRRCRGHRRCCRCCRWPAAADAMLTLRGAARRRGSCSHGGGKLGGGGLARCGQLRQWRQWRRWPQRRRRVRRDSLAGSGGDSSMAHGGDSSSGRCRRMAWRRHRQRYGLREHRVRSQLLWLPALTGVRRAHSVSRLVAIFASHHIVTLAHNTVRNSMYGCIFRIYVGRIRITAVHTSRRRWPRAAHAQKRTHMLLEAGETGAEGPLRAVDSSVYSVQP